MLRLKEIFLLIIDIGFQRWRKVRQCRTRRRLPFLRHAMQVAKRIRLQLLVACNN
jgi:hypothetical protein